MIRSRYFNATTLVLPIVCCTLLPIGKLAVAAAPSAAEIDGWIGELGNDNYTVRKAAAERLANGGLAARAALAAVADGPDPEIRSSARRLMTLIDDTEFNRRLGEFASDVDGSRGITLPGWKEFGDVVGSDAAARALFVDMQREEAALMQRIFDAPANNREISWDDQIVRLIRARISNRPGNFGASPGSSAPLGSCATMLFLGTLPDANLSDGGANGLAQLTQIPPVSEALAAKRPENALRRLVSAWVVHCPNRSEPVLQQRLSVLFQYQLSEALPLALEMVGRDPKNLTLRPPEQVMAILAIGKFGSEENLADLEPLLDDRNEFLAQQPANVPGSTMPSVQVRDVALAALLHLTGQEPLTYGFLHARTHPQMLFDVTSLTMENDERRAAAAEQWRAWRAQHKQQPPQRPASS